MTSFKITIYMFLLSSNHLIPFLFVGIMSGPSKNEYYSSDKTTESVAQSTGVEGGEGAEEPSRKRKAEDVPCEGIVIAT